MSSSTATTLAPDKPGIPDIQFDAWRALVNAHAALVGTFEEALADEQLPPLAWFGVLGALYRADDHRLRPRDLGLHLTISKSGLTRLVDRMVAAGLIERRDCPSDRRGHLIALTDSGEAVFRDMWPIYAQSFEASFASRLSADEAETLRALLDRLRDTACAAAGAEFAE
jgi:DNA-binding MarR family transcriptional regulator